MTTIKTSTITTKTTTGTSAKISPIVNATATNTTNNINVNSSASRCTLGIVAKCTLTCAQFINVEKRKYCVIDEGYKTQSEAIDHCKTLNSRLPVPRSKAELFAFINTIKKHTWIGIIDSGRDCSYSRSIFS